jgi:tRNA-dihydrouridine synthase 1
VRRYFDILWRYVYDREPPVRRELFVPGMETGWLVERKEEEGGQPVRKKRKQDGGEGKKKEEVVKGSPNLVAVQGHLFHLLRHFVSKHHDVRDALARARAGDMVVLEKILDMVERKVAEGLLEYEKGGDGGVEQAATAEEGDQDYYDPESSEKAVRVCKRPWWVVQPIIRPVPKEAMAKGAIQPKREKGAPRKKEGKGAADTATLMENGNGNGDVARVGEGGETAGDSHAGSKEALKRKTSFPESELVSG